MARLRHVKLRLKLAVGIREQGDLHIVDNERRRSVRVGSKAAISPLLDQQMRLASPYGTGDA